MYNQFNTIDNIELGIRYEGFNYPSLEYRKEHNAHYVYIPILIEETADDDTPDSKIKYTWEYIKIARYAYNYENLINHIVGYKYDLSSTIAIICNYLSDEKDKKYKKEFDALQEWRMYAKATAKKLFDV